VAICYEISVSDHAADAIRNGAAVYVASVAKTQKGIVKANERMSEIARSSSIITLLSNCIGPSGDGDCAGQTAIWAPDGSVAVSLNDSDEGIAMIDTATMKAEAFYLVNRY